MGIKQSFLKLSSALLNYIWGQAYFPGGLHQSVHIPDNPLQGEGWQQFEMAPTSVATANAAYERAVTKLVRASISLNKQLPRSSSGKDDLLDTPSTRPALGLGL